ncbi:MAG: LamG domain-containing protein [Lentisphaerae bacterium]|nr:LamG domain-containing protein [Lentisphaerota bacterium]
MKQGVNFLKGWILAAALCAAGPAARGDMLYYLPFEDGAGNSSLTNAGTLGGVATEKLFNGAPAGSYITNTPPGIASEQARYMEASAGNRGAMYWLPDSSNRLTLSSGTAEMTVTAWVRWDGDKVPDVSRDVKCGIAGNWMGTKGGWAFGISTDGKLGFIGDNNTATRPQSEERISYGGWTHVALVLDQNINGLGRYTFYINGEDAGNTASWDSPVTDWPQAVWVGSCFSTSGWPLNGALDDVRLYDEALTEAEIQAMVPARTMPEPLYVLSFENAAGSGSLTNSGTLGGTAVEDATGVGLTPGTYTNDVVDGLGTTLARAVPTSVNDGPFYILPDSTNRLTLNLAADQRQMTIAAWVKWYGKVNTYAGSMENGIAGNWSPDGWSFGLWDNGKPALIADNDAGIGTFLPYATNGIPVGVWTHVAVTIELGYTGVADYVTFYINGVEKPNAGAALDNVNNPGGHIWVGTTFGAGTRPFNGILDEVRLYDRVLTPNELNTLLNRGLKYYFPFEDAAGNGSLTNAAMPGGTAVETLFDPSLTPGSYSSDVPSRLPSRRSLDLPMTFFTGQNRGPFYTVPDSAWRLLLTGEYGHTNLTVSAYVKWDGSPTTEKFQMHSGIAGGWVNNDGTVSGWCFGLTTNGWPMLWRDSKLNYTLNPYTSQAVVPIGRWTHVGVTVDLGTAGSEQVRFYMNGRPYANEGTALGAANERAADFWFGSAFNSGGRPLNGSLDELRLYDKVLSDAEMAELYPMKGSMILLR